MDQNLNGNEALVARIQQLEQERGELQKDIEHLCMQHAGPSYLAVATRMHFQRTASLEQEIENLKKKLATCTRENINLQEELSEAYRIKSQLADLHNAEVSKNMEADKQVKFFQGCVAAAFAERDHAVMEAEKAKEKEEVVSHKLSDFQKRIEELASDCLEEKKLSATLQIDLEKQEKENGIFKKVIDKFYEIRQPSPKGLDDTSWEDKCELLLRDSEDTWSFNDYGETSTSKYITALEEEVGTLRKSVDNLQNKLQMGLEIENHLKKKVCKLEKKKILSEEKMKRDISGLHHYHSLYRVHIMNLLDEGYSNLKSTANALEEKVNQLDFNREQNSKTTADINLYESECRDVHVNTDDGSDLVSERNVPSMPNTVNFGSGEVSEAFSQALQEKVDALLLLSQQEERYLLESNVNVALQKKMEELQRNLIQATNEKVKALMELAQLKQEYQLLQEQLIEEMKDGKPLSDTGERRIVQAANGRLKSLLKKTYFRRWIDPTNSTGNEAESHLDSEGNLTNKRSNCNMDFARMKIENAALRECLENMEHLTSSVHRLRLSLLKAKELITSEDTLGSKSEALANIVSEAKLMKIALGSFLPVSWSAEHSDVEATGVGGGEKVDCVSASGFEMVELLILAAQVLRDDITIRGGGGLI
ncbi:hypothetical protein LguiB_006994 [Lonicera macranthoides]